MKQYFLFILIFTFCQTNAFSADLIWHSFDLSNKKAAVISIGKIDLAFSHQTKSANNKPFKADDLLLNLTNSKGILKTYSFKSSYSRGKVALFGHFLLIEYGVGRGTSARTECIKIFDISKAFIEVANIKTSYWLSKKNLNLPAKIAYELSVHKTKTIIEFKFFLSAPHKTLPTEKIVNIKF